MRVRLHVSQENISHIITPLAVWTFDSRKFGAVYANFWPHHQHVAAEVWFFRSGSISLVYSPASLSSYELAGPEALIVIFSSILFISRSDSCIFKLPFCSSLPGLLTCILVNLNESGLALWHHSLTWHVVPSGPQLLITLISGNSRYSNARKAAISEMLKPVRLTPAITSEITLHSVADGGG